MSNQIISKEGHDKLKKELDYLLTVKRFEISKKIEIAKEFGDLSENAEYHEAKEAQAFNEGKIAELSSLLKNITVVDKSNSGEKVSIGSKITVSINEQTKEYVIVSFNESDPVAGKISNESPLGIAFLNKKKGDNVIVKTPNGEMKYKILKIE